MLKFSQIKNLLKHKDWARLKGSYVTRGSARAHTRFNYDNFTGKSKTFKANRRRELKKRNKKRK